MYPQHGVGPGMVYASPTPNGGMIFSLGGEAAGRGQFIIPLPLGLPAQQAAADLSKAKKWHIFLIYSRFFLMFSFELSFQFLTSLEIISGLLKKS